MDVELIEIRDFLADYPPFSLLAAEQLNALPKQMAIRYLRRGSAFPPEDAASPQLYLIRSGAIELRDRDEHLLDKLGEGDYFDAACFAAPSAAAATAGAIEATADVVGLAVADSLIYLLPCAVVRELRRTNDALDAHFARATSDRLRHARNALHEHGTPGNRLLSMSIGDFVRRAPVTAPPEMTIFDAARRMTDESVSALLVTDDGALVGIVTDRDLRSRCLATERSGNEPLSSIMSREVVHIGPDSAAFEALMRMTQHAIHHLPVSDAGGLRGLVSSTDLLRWQSANAVYLGALTRRADSVAELMRISAELPELQVEMLAGGATAGQIGQAISSVNDLITARLLALAESTLGAPPVPYAWLACGSQGRHEQTVHSDQDNALILHDSYEADAHQGYFLNLARFVNDGLDACGYRYCPGEVMASNPAWRQPQFQWLRNFRDWIAHTDEKAAMLVANFADLRVVAGDAGLHAPLLEEIAHDTSRHENFLGQMVANTLRNKPPLGFFGKFLLARGGEHAHTFDSKRQGLLPIADLARIHALANARPEVGTVKRLRALAACGGLSSESASELEEAFEFLGALRARHQASQIRRGDAPDNYIDPDRLTALERRHLRDVFAVISQMQRALALRFAARTTI